MEENTLTIEILGGGIAWLDTGTHESLLSASNFVKTIQSQQGLMIACLEEIAFNNKWINKKQLMRAVKFYGNCSYSDYIKKLF